ncbi:MAG: cation diffusion facilitator family transporter [Actinomycetota bacterium]|nr:cation diffusion facilitator family transporter [Actinomycetota bacterium]
MATSTGARDAEAGTKRTIYAALFANALIAIAKFVAGLISGSSAMLAEGAHSVADTTNQLFLLISLRLSKAPPDEEHPYGHGKDRFFWSFLVAVLIFFVGALFSFYQGVTTLLHTGEEDHESFLISYVVLGAAFVFEAIALTITVREFLHAARTENRTFWNYFKVTANTSLKVPLYEDAAALTGLLIAAAGLLLVQITGSTNFDGIASIGIGIILLIVAWELGTDSRRLLLGEAMLPADRRRIEEAVASFPEVTGVLRLLTMHLGPDAVLVNAEIHVVDGLATDQIEELLERITRRLRNEMPEVVQTFIELHPPGRVQESSPRER